MIQTMGTLRFLLEVVGAAAFIAMGLLMAVWPATYFRWVRWSERGSYFQWLHGKWDLEHARWQAKGLGIVFVLFGSTLIAAVVWIHWFQ